MPWVNQLKIWEKITPNNKLIKPQLNGTSDCAIFIFMTLHDLGAPFSKTKKALQ